MKGRQGSEYGASPQGRRNNSANGSDNSAHRGARPFSSQRCGGGASSRSWSHKRKATRPSVSVEDRTTQPIKHVIPLDLSFGNFEFQEMKSLGKRGGGVRELSSLLRQARRKAATHAGMLHTQQGAKMRSEDLLSAAVQRSAGMKVKDDPHLIAKALAKHRRTKRQSAKRWAKRIKHLEDSVENVVKDRSIQKQTMKARKESTARAKEKRREATSGNGAGRGGGASKEAGGSGGKSVGAKKQKSFGGKQQRRGGSSGRRKR
ncbi:Surfeit locus protein 6, putative [Leishmania lindenbergi]|uniref:Surfeit locus protein 6 n=1 Tax=Leishmania lindenbergi TaxID=651832 RepID=A0AAW3ADJ8_9TRYP